MSRIFGYCRVSSKEQNEGRQMVAIKDYCNSINLSIDERDILIDKQSGKDFDRANYNLLKRFVRKGDIVIVKELDRLGRNKADVKREIEWFKSNEISLRILNIPTTLVDFTGYDSGMAKSMMEMINNVLIEVLGTIAEEERIKIKQRQREGIQFAKSEGKHLGRPKKDYPDRWNEYYDIWKKKNITAKLMMKELELKPNTFYRMIKRYEAELNNNTLLS